MQKSTLNSSDTIAVSQSKNERTLLSLSAYILIAISLYFSFHFYLKFGTDIAITVTFIQGLVISFCPALIKRAWHHENTASYLSGSVFLALALAASIFGSSAVLNSTTAADKKVVLDRAAKTDEIEKLKSKIDGYHNGGYYTRATPFEQKLEKANKELAALPTPSEIYFTAVSWVGDEKAFAFISLLILGVSLLLDLVAVYFLASSAVITMIHTGTINKEVEQESSSDSSPAPTSPNGGGKKRNVAHSLSESLSNVFTFSSNSDVNKVLKALKSGEIDKITVKVVRPFLGCSQDRATEIAREAKKCLVQTQAA